MSERKPTLNLVGAGRVGQTLAHLWNTAGVFEVQDVLTTSRASAEAACEFIGAGRAVESMALLRPADVWMLAVQDARIAEVAQALASGIGSPCSPPDEIRGNGLPRTPAATDPADSGILARPIAFHCSGAQSSTLLAALAALGWHTASAHPILSFASAATAITQFNGTPCALEGDAAATPLLAKAFTAIGGQCFAVSADNKLLYHAAAVFATNFLPVLESLAEDAWVASGVPEALLPGLRASLMANAVANITRLGPAGALTGPAAREDTAAIARQAQTVRAWNPAAADAYDALSTLALRMAKAKREATATAVKAH